MQSGSHCDESPIDERRGPVVNSEPCVPSDTSRGEHSSVHGDLIRQTAGSCLITTTLRWTPHRPSIVRKKVCSFVSVTVRGLCGTVSRIFTWSWRRILDCFRSQWLRSSCQLPKKTRRISTRRLRPVGLSTIRPGSLARSVGLQNLETGSALDLFSGRRASLRMIHFCAGLP